MEKWIQTSGEVWNCAIISRHYGKTLSAYLELFYEAKKDFEGLTFYDVECREVINSIRCKGNSMLTFQIPAGSEIPAGWHTSDYVEELRR